MTASTKPLSIWTHFYSLIKYFSSFIIFNKLPTEPSHEDECLNKTDYESFQCLPSISRNTFDQVYITDCDETYQWASKDTYMFSMFKFLQKFKYLRFFLDGVTEINPCWRSVLHLADVINKNAFIEITDTLILHCESIEAYSKVIPCIRGTYSILILHGHMTWRQIKQLYHPGVKQIRINATFEITPNEHEEFVDFVIKHCRGMNYKFSIAYEAKCPLDILKKIYNATGESRFMDIEDRGCDVNCIYRLLVIVFVCFIPYLLTGISYLVFCFITTFTTYDKIGEVTSIVIFIAVFFTSAIGIFRMVTAAPTDVRIDVKNKNFNDTLNYIIGE